MKDVEHARQNKARQREYILYILTFSMDYGRGYTECVTQAEWLCAQRHNWPTDLSIPEHQSTKPTEEGAERSRETNVLIILTLCCIWSPERGRYWQAFRLSNVCVKLAPTAGFVLMVDHREPLLVQEWDMKQRHDLIFKGSTCHA